MQEKKIFSDILEQKNTSLGYKRKRSSEGGKIDVFPKGLTHGFGPRTAIFRTFFLGNIGQENIFYGFLERKNFLLGYKNKKFKRSKHSHFPIGINPCFWSK